MDLIGDLVHTQGIAAIVSTHDPLLVQRADRVIELHDGRVTSDTRAAASPRADGGSTDAAAPPLTRAEARARQSPHD
jgi:putative ABC transport system ATP-binding protein